MMLNVEESSTKKTGDNDQRPQIVLTMYSTQHALLQSFRQIYLTAQGLALVAVSILIARAEIAFWQVLCLTVCGMLICVIWSCQCCQRFRAWQFFRGYLHKLESSPVLSVNPLEEYKNEFRGAGYCKQITMLEALGYKRRLCHPCRWSPAFLIDIVLPLFFLIIWIFILLAALPKAT